MPADRKVTPILVILALLGVLIGSQMWPGGRQLSSAEEEIVFGALLTNTAVWASLGQASQAALQLAAEDVNGYLTQSKSKVRVRIIVEDTGGDPMAALEALKRLEAQGVRIVFGPQTSAEVGAVKSYADEHDLLIISHASTAGSLAIPDDNIFRLTPDDGHEGQAAVALMSDDGIKIVVPIWRDDAGNAGLRSATERGFEALGGVVLDGVKYAAPSTDYSTAVSDLSDQVQLAIDRYGADAVGIYLAAFDEAVSILEQAQYDPFLSSVRWYGSDGVAHSQALIANPAAAQFAANAGYPNPILGLDEGAKEKWMPLLERVMAVMGREPDAFSLGAYDGLWIATLAYLSVGEPSSTEALKYSFIQVASSYFGTTGWTVLNEAGDKKHGSFDFWAVTVDEAIPRWVRVARYEETSDGKGRVIRY